LFLKPSFLPTFVTITRTKSILFIRTHVTNYFYRVGSASKREFQSEVGTFTTGRSNDDKDSFQIAVYGDLGGDKNALDTIELVSSMAEAKEIDFVYHVGGYFLCRQCLLGFDPSVWLFL
jgi:hypothetical protein